SCASSASWEPAARRRGSPTNAVPSVQPRLCSHYGFNSWHVRCSRRAMNLHELKHKEEIYALGQYLLGFVLVGLVLVGIGGTIYKVISPDGWVALAFGRSLSAGAASLRSLSFIAELAWP